MLQIGVGEIYLLKLSIPVNDLIRKYMYLHFSPIVMESIVIFDVSAG